MDDDDKNMRVQREAASWNASPLMIPGIVAAVILLMVASTLMGKMGGAASPSPSANPAPATPTAEQTRKTTEIKMKMQKMNDAEFIKKYQGKAKKFSGDFSKLSPDEQKELNDVTQDHGRQFFEMLRSRP